MPRKRATDRRAKSPGGRKHWTKQRVVDALRELHLKGTVRITANALVSAGYLGLASAIHHYIGSFERARRLARIPPPGRLAPETVETWDEDRVVAGILARHRAGESLAYKQVPTKLIDAALYYCDSWKNAVETAGIDYATVRRSSQAWTRDAIVTALRAAAVSGRATRSVPDAVWQAARRHFGSTDAALRTAGVETQLARRRIRTNEGLAESLRELIAAHPRMSPGAMRSAPLGRVLIRRFKTVENGMRELGIRWRPGPDGRSRPRKR